MKPENFLLDNELRLRISDFAGSSLDQSVPTVCPPSKYSRPNTSLQQFSIQDDIFGLGSTFFKIMTGKDPYDNLSDEDVDKRFKVGDFPDTSDLVLGEVIRKCWEGQIASVQTLCDLIKGLVPDQ